jgi:hypothetical protein
VSRAYHELDIQRNHVKRLEAEKEEAWKWVIFGTRQYQEQLRELIALRARSEQRGRTIQHLQAIMNGWYKGSGLHDWCKSLLETDRSRRNQFFNMYNQVKEQKLTIQELEERVHQLTGEVSK